MILSALAQLWSFGEAEDGLAKHQPDQRPLPTSLRSSGVPLWAAFSAWHSTPTNVGRHGTTPPTFQWAAPHTGPSTSLHSSGGPLWAAFSAWHSTPNKCGGSTGSAHRPPHIPTIQLGALMGGVQRLAFNAKPMWGEHRHHTHHPHPSGLHRTPAPPHPYIPVGVQMWREYRLCTPPPPHPYIPVGGPYGRRSAPGIQRQTNVGGAPALHTGTAHRPLHIPTFQ